MTARPRGAHVAGSDAYLLSVFLRRADVDGFLSRLSATTIDRRRLGALRDLVDTIHAAADEHAACASASAQGSVAQAATESRHDEEWISVEDASLLLAVTPARVRQIRASHLDWRRLGREYQVTRSSVLIYAETRRKAAS